MARGSLRGVLGVTLVGCATLGGGLSGDDGPRFPHAEHGEDQALDCQDCHRGAAKGAAAGFPKARQCDLCHEELDEEKPPARRASALFDGKTLRTRPAADRGDVRFSHAAHVGASDPVACETCHAGATRAVSEMDTCVDCHTARSAPTRCGTCHTEIRREREPPSHDLSWRRRHGDRVGSGEVVDRCEMCHQTSSCEACHRAEAPRDHDALWRLQGHAVAAGFDRDTCGTCHQVDFCDACHQVSPPANHVAGWGSPGDTHCLSCHVDDRGDEGCGVCHRGDLGHRSAPPRPPSHHAGMDCRQCHGSRQPLPHTDTGVPCLACHR